MTYESNMTPEQSENLLELKKIQQAISDKFGEIKETTEQVKGEIKELGEAKTETKAAVEKLNEEYNALYDRVQTIEQKGAHLQENAQNGQYDVGAEFVKSDQFKMLQEGRQNIARMEVKTAIINATGQNQPLVPSDRLGGINTTPNRELTIRDMIPTSATDSNLIEFVRENTFTNNAGPQVSGSPEAFENVTKPESGITFTLVTEAVQTLAHWIPASKQVLSDSAGLQSFISNRLMYGLKLYEENQLLNGTGSNGQLNGLVTQATAYTVQSPNLTNELDIVREMIKQAHVANYRPDGIILNPQDWYDIDVKKVGSSDDRYIVGNPRSMSSPTLWGLPVVVTNAISSGTCLLGSFSLGAEIKDRMQAVVEVSRENSDNFVKNMCTILAEERIALCVYRTEAFITGSV